MVVLSSKEEPVIKAQAFALGANDYLVKLPDKLELVARVRYHSRAYLNLLERNEAFRQPGRKSAPAGRGSGPGRPLRAIVVAGEAHRRPPHRLAVRPSTQLGGDMFGYHWLDPDHLAVYLLDVSGHGVGSSLLAVSAANLLSGKALANTDFTNPGQVLSRLNDVFQMEKQNHKYFTMWYGVYDRARRVLSYSNAGHPPALVFTGPNPGGSTLELCTSCGLAIGMMEGTEFDSKTVSLGPYARLLLYSDGVYEIDKPDGVMWKHKEFVEFMSSLPRGSDSVMANLLAHARKLHGADVLADDFSILDIRW